MASTTECMNISAQVTLLNRGDIAADWTLQAPHTPFASKFRFGPTQGTLDVKDRREALLCSKMAIKIEVP